VRRTATLLALGALAGAGCGSSDDSATPVACLGSPAAYLDALAAAPGEVRLADDTAISSCLTEGQSGGELATVSDSVVTAATKLNVVARLDPSGEATVSLGYLDGAIHAGASTTGGIHADLVRRVDAAARFNPGGGSPGVDFERAFGKGYAAGQETG
jgi:hypothetical protein